MFTNNLKKEKIKKKRQQTTIMR